MFPIRWAKYLVLHSFPRIRGDVPKSLQRAGHIRMFSPHTRGCSFRGFFALYRPEVFPAYAGMFRGCNRNQSASGSFPRIRGDVPRGPDHRYYFFRFSPHTRGCSYLDVLGEMPAVVFPAYAGMFPRTCSMPDLTPRFPRIRGDVPTKKLRETYPHVFSPHTRGCSVFQIVSTYCLFVFPAYAGMFLFTGSQRQGNTRFPRIRGDVPCGVWWCPLLSWFSPHTRGCSAPRQ